jgi:acyl-CoA thioesterase
MTPQAIFDTMMKTDAFSRWLGLSLEAIGEGYCRLNYVITPDMLNGFGTVHGGILFSAADSAFAFACNSHGRLSVALDVSISFTKSAKVGERLSVEAKEVYLGNKTSVYDIITRNEAQEVVAIFKGTAYRTEKKVG